MTVAAIVVLACSVVALVAWYERWKAKNAPRRRTSSSGAGAEVSVGSGDCDGGDGGGGGGD